MSRHVRIPTAVITFDYLWDERDTEDEVGKAWVLGEACEVMQVTGNAYDDDGERYYKLHVNLPVADPDQEDALCNLLSILGRHAGVTSITFPGRKELDVG